MKEDNIFIDTNILVYAYDVSSSMLLTEDLNNGQIIEGVLIKNHFTA